MVPWVSWDCGGLGAEGPALDAHRAKLPRGASSCRAAADIWARRKADERAICSTKLQRV